MLEYHIWACHHVNQGHFPNNNPTVVFSSQMDPNNSKDLKEFDVNSNVCLHLFLNRFHPTFSCFYNAIIVIL